MTTAKPARTYGFRIEPGHKWAESESFCIRILAREGDAAHPINPSLDGESSYYGAPKAADGLMLHGLVIRAYRSEYKSGGAFLRPAEFEDAHYVKSGDCKRMLKTFDRITRELRKAQFSEEIGDYLGAVAKAIGATFYVRETRKSDSSSYSESDWSFESIANLKTAARAEWAKLEAAHRAKFGEGVEA
jgi:hypothetical protein